MSFWNTVVEACAIIGISACLEDAPKIELPKDDGALLNYTKRDEKPAPKKPEPVPTMPPLVVEKTIEKTVYVNQAAPPAPVAEPKPDPQVVAYNQLLALRRIGSFDNRLQTKHYAISAQNTSSQNGIASLNAPSIPAFQAGLDFEFNKGDDDYPTRYEHSGVDSGLPIDNARIMRSDRYISGVFEGGVNSQLATGGEVVVQVSEHVFGYHGRNILIPKGSRMVCSYEVPALANSTRLEFGCDRIYLADSAVEIYQLKTKLYDAQGNLGVSGLVDRRFWDRYGEAIIITGISAATRIAAGSIKTSDNQNLTSSVNAGVEDLSQKFGEITASILENQINTKPIIRIAQGTTVTIKPSSHWYISQPREGLIQ